MGQIDASYRLLFSSPALIQALLTTPWLAPLTQAFDLSSLRPVSTDLLSPRLRQRRADLVWQVRRNDGALVYALILLEHQSRVDAHMALRVSTYCHLLMEDMLRQRAASQGPMPALFPVVLYSGVRRWTAPLQLRALIDAVPATLERFQPTMEYVLVDEGALVGRHTGGTNRSGAAQQSDMDQATGDATEPLPRNLAHILFRLEHNKGVDDVVALLTWLAQLTAGPEYQELQRAFAAWVRHVLWPRAVPQGRKAVNLPETNLVEIATMMKDQSRSWEHQWLQQGLKQGLQRGVQQGKREGEALLLERLLSRRFGPLSNDVKERLQTASATQLETRALNFVDATELEQVFAD